MRPTITSRDIESKRYQPRIAIIDDAKNPATQRVLDLIKKAGAKPMIIPRELSERLLKSVNLSNADIEKLSRAKQLDEVANYEPALLAATKMHLQYIARKLTYVDAVVLPGNEYDIPPSAYHDPHLHTSTNVAPPLDVRFQTELLMADYALHTRKIPLLGISGGMQLLVVKTGGRLIQHLDDYNDVANQTFGSASIAGANSKELTRKPDAICMVKPRSILGAILKDRADILGESDFNGEALGLQDNHHQAVRLEDVNQRELLVTAVTPNNLVEAVEHKNHPFCLGVQFHPEYDAKFNIGFEMIQSMVDFARDIKLPLKEALPGQETEHFLDWANVHEQLDSRELVLV